MKLSRVGILGLMFLGGSNLSECPGWISVKHSSPLVDRCGCCSHHGGGCGCEKGWACSFLTIPSLTQGGFKFQVQRVNHDAAA